MDKNLWLAEECFRSASTLSLHLCLWNAAAIQRNRHSSKGRRTKPGVQSLRYLQFGEIKKSGNNMISV